jgi:signal transduction histidine kinase
MLTQYFLALITTAVTHAILACFVFFKGRKRLTNVTYACYSFSISLWSGVEAFAITATDSATGLLFWRLNHVGVILIPIFFAHFVVSLLPAEAQKRKKLHIVSSYVVGLFFLILNFSGILITDVIPKFDFNYFITPNPIYVAFFSLWVVWVAHALMMLFGLYFKAEAAQKRKLSYFTISMLVAYLGGALNFLPTFGIHIPVLMPFGTYAIPIYAFFTAYAIVAYRLMDIDVIIRKTLVFAGLFSVVFGVFAFFSFLTQELFSAYTGRGRLLPVLLSVAFIVLVYDPIRRLLVNLTDRYLFQRKFNYQKLLSDASAGISKIKSLHHLLNLVVHFVTMRVRVKCAAVLMYDDKDQSYRFCYPRGYTKGHRLLGGIKLDRYDPLIEYMSHEHAPLDLEEVRKLAEIEPVNRNKSNGKKQYDYRVIQMRMEELEASCCVPSFLGRNLRHALILGDKKSGDFYTEQDLHMLYTLAQESAIAIENARLYDQAVEKAKELETINDQLNTAQNQLIRALSDTEIANKKLRDTHAQLIHEQKMATLGRLASSVGHEVNNPLTILSMNVSRAILKFRRNPDLKVSEILDTFQKMEQNISRIKAVVNTLTGLLKKSEHGKFEPLSLKLVLEETLPLVQFQTYLENLSGTEVEFDIPSGLPLIKGDLERLQEVFLNLFINAYHAMVGIKRKRKITVSARENPAHPAMVTIDFSDNGTGMPDDVLKKVFSYGFTTKPAGKGSGMGLYMCRYIIELHGGEIKVRSRIGEGTTFVITLPAFMETSASGALEGS